MSLAATLLLNLTVVLMLMTAPLGVSVAISDTSIADIFWGAGFVVIAWGGGVHASVALRRATSRPG